MQAGFFVIADISGYTAFVAQNDLVHAQGVLAEITGLLIEKLCAPFRFVELEGDAVFVFAPDVAVEDSERLVDILEVCYAAFRIRLEQMSINTSCECMGKGDATLYSGLDFGNGATGPKRLRRCAPSRDAARQPTSRSILHQRGS